MLILSDLVNIHFNRLRQIIICFDRHEFSNYTRTPDTAVIRDAAKNHLEFFASCLEYYQFLSISKGDQRTETQQFGGRN